MCKRFSCLHISNLSMKTRFKLQAWLDQMHASAQHGCNFNLHHCVKDYIARLLQSLIAWMGLICSFQYLTQKSILLQSTVHKSVITNEKRQSTIQAISIVLQLAVPVLYCITKEGLDPGPFACLIDLSGTWSLGDWNNEAYCEFQIR